MSKARSIKICYIGGGSRCWATRLMGDLALCPDITGELVLYDIDHAAALRNEDHGNRLYAQEDALTRFAVRACEDLSEALRGSDVVVISIEPGPTEMRFADLEIPYKYGIYHTVGDTTGPGGIMRAARAVPVFLRFAHEIMTYCPQAWVINYTNPMTLCTQALYVAEPKIKAFGCCHEVYGTQEHLLQLACRHLGLLSTGIPRQKVRLEVSGVNHFTMVSKASFQGIDVLQLARNRLEQADLFADRTEHSLERVSQGRLMGAGGQLVAYDFLRNFAVLGAAGDRHLVENVPWYIGDGDDSLHRWGVVRTTYHFRAMRAQAKRQEVYEAKPLIKSREEGVEQILGVLGLRDWDSNVNLPNEGQMPQLPRGAVVETMACFRDNSLRPIQAAPLPPAAAALQQAVCRTQQACLTAILHRDREALFAALLTDPMCTISTDAARCMFNDMCDYTSEYISF